MIIWGHNCTCWSWAQHVPGVLSCTKLPRGIWARFQEQSWAQVQLGAGLGGATLWGFPLALNLMVSQNKKQIPPVEEASPASPGSSQAQEHPKRSPTHPPQTHGRLRGSWAVPPPARVPQVRGFGSPPPQFRSDCRLGMSQKLRAKPRGRRCLQREGSARGQCGDSPAAGAVPPGHRPGSPCPLGMA